MADYVKGLGITSNFMIELFDLRNGLLLAQNRRLLPMLIEVDAMAMFHAISGCDPNILSMFIIYLKTRKLLTILDNPSTRHIL